MSGTNVTITLPAGYTYESYLVLEGMQVAIAINVCAVFAIICWDYFVLLPEEVSIYRMMLKERRFAKGPTTYLFLILRYSVFLAILPSVLFSSAQIGDCQSAIVASQVGVVLVTAAAGAIFCFRVFALWNGNRIVQGVITLAYTFMLACWISVATQYASVTGPHTPFASNCLNKEIPSWNPISWGSSVAFDTIVLALTIFKLRPNLVMQKSAVGRQIFIDTIMYFSITAITNIIALILEALPSTNLAAKASVIAFPPLMTAAMGSRVYLNLRLLESRRRKELEGLPISSVNASSGSRGGTDRYQPPYTTDTDGTAMASYTNYHATASTDKVDYSVMDSPNKSYLALGKPPQVHVQSSVETR